MLWERGEYEELLAEAARLLQKDRSDATGRYFHSLALSRAGATASSRSWASCSSRSSARGPDPVLMEELAAAYARAGLPELAEGWYERAMKLAEPSVGALASLADVYEALGKREKLAGAFLRYSVDRS